MKKSMKKRFVLLGSLFVAFALCIGLLVPTVAVANADDGDGVTVTGIKSSATNELLYFGDEIHSFATVNLSDGSTAEREIAWTNLNANDVNSVFSMAEAVGKVKGTNLSVSRRFFTLPKGLVYFVNCGSINDHEDEGYNDIYYDMNSAILDNYYSEYTADHLLLNKVPDQEKTNSNTWGYAPYKAGYPIANKRMPTKAGDPMPPAYPYNAIRSTDSSDNNYGITYTLGGLDGNTKYRMYLGTRSHWHMRRVTPWINGKEQSQLEIPAMAKVTIYDNITPSSGEIKLELRGAYQDEGNCAFIAIQPMAEAEKIAKQVPKDLTVDGDLTLGTTKFTVHNAEVGSKVQVSLAEAPFNILYEEIVTETQDGDFEVEMSEESLNGVFSFRLTAINNFGASTPTQVFITDITDFSLEYDDDNYRPDDLPVTLKANAASGIVRLEVFHNFITTTYDDTNDKSLGKEAYEGTILLRENGSYTFTLYSGVDAFVSRTINVTTIDKADFTLTVDMATSGITEGKPLLSLTAQGSAPVVSYTMFDADGEELASGDAMPGVLDLDYGRYVFYAMSASGKVATTSAVISEKSIYFTATGKAVSRGVTYTFKGANGKTIQGIRAYSVNANGVATPLVGTATSVSNYSSTDVYVRITYTDGTIEFNKLDVPIAAASSKKSGCGSAAGAASLSLALGALALCGVVIGVKKKAKKAN